MSDLGLTHVALAVGDVERSIDFYARFARLDVVHRRKDESTGRSVVWLSDRTRPFAVVLIEVERVDATLSGIAHLGVGCPDRAEVDRLLALAGTEGRPSLGPFDSGYPVGYWGLIADPDGHNLEVSHGQEVGLAVRGGS